MALADSVGVRTPTESAICPTTAGGEQGLLEARMGLQPRGCRLRVRLPGGEAVELSCGRKADEGGRPGAAEGSEQRPKRPQSTGGSGCFGCWD